MNENLHIRAHAHNDLAQMWTAIGKLENMITTLAAYGIAVHGLHWIYQRRICAVPPLKIGTVLLHLASVSTLSLGVNLVWPRGADTTDAAIRYHYAKSALCREYEYSDEITTKMQLLMAEKMDDRFLAVATAQTQYECGQRPKKPASYLRYFGKI